MIKIFSLPAHQEKTRTHGADMVRIIQPMKYLGKEKGFKTTIYDMEEQTTDVKYLLDVARNNDIIYFNYMSDPWGFAHMGAFARKFGTKLIMDIDDDIWDTHTDNPAHPQWAKGGEKIRNFTLICNEVDYITCTNDYLKHVIMNHTNKTADKIKVIPNYIDLSLYKHRSPFKNDGEIVLTYFGSSTHWLDLSETEFVRGMERIMKEYPNAKFRTIGAWKQDFRKKWGARYENLFGHQDVYHWIADKDKFPMYMDETDIMVVPLVSDIYNQCKSQIKWLEASSAKKPGVWKRIRQYEEVVDGTNGILASKDTEWYRAIKYLITNPDKRKAMGEKAFEDVNKWTIQKNIDIYKDFFKEVLTK
jgi:glycosyltransferase involved in cell wall biosynthesis